MPKKSKSNSVKPKKERKARVSGRSLRLGLFNASEAFGVAFNSVKLAIREAIIRGEIMEREDKKYLIREFYIALAGDYGALRREKMRQSIKESEFDLAVKQREYIKREECAKFILDTFSPHREMVVSMPGQLAALVNPSDPVHARGHLERWRDDFLRLKANVPTEKEN